MRTIGVAVNMSPCHGEDRGFDSHMVRHFIKLMIYYLNCQIVRHLKPTRPDSSVGRAKD